MNRVAVVFLAALLAGCGATLAPLGSGYYSKEPVLNPDGTIATNALTRQPIYKTVRKSQHVAIAEAGAQALSGRTDDGERDDLTINAMDCTLGFSPDQVAALSATGQGAHYDAVEECVSSYGIASIVAASASAGERAVAAALGRPVSEGDAIARAYRDTVGVIEQGKSERTKARYGFAGTAAKFIVGAVALDNFGDSLAAVGIAAANAGGTKFNGPVSVNQSGGDSSDDPTGGAGGAASAGEGDLAPDAVASNAGGEGGGSAVAGSPVTNTVVFGNENQLGVSDGDVQITDGAKADINVNTSTGSIFEDDADGLNDGSTGTLNLNPQVGF